MKSVDTKRRLRRVSRKLANIPSLGYALLYLGCIPLFATIYYLLPYHFYHSTVQYENVLNEDASIILTDLSEQIIKNFKREHGNFYVEASGWTVNITTLRPLSLKADSGKIIIPLSMEVEKKERENKTELKFTFTVSFPVETGHSSWAPGDEYFTDYKYITVETPANLPIPAKVIFPYKDQWEADTLILPIPRPLNDRLTGFAYGIRGFPSRTSGSYARMFYLSAVTITTLGYGDIVPITTASRLLVAIEAILGIVLIGLFLNALAHENQNHDEQE